ncbi:DUF1330 domain-containing protein [Bradyrhizobium brasilense]|nr:DUF1330 domain-containing protein [Bradyrhizobium brasilense]
MALVMLSCTAIGALGTEALHGEARPPAYLIGQIEVTDPDGYAREYLPKAKEIIKAHGGKLIAAAGAAATGSQVVAVDGDPPKRVVIYMYPSMEALWAWRHDPAYVQVRAVGEKYARYHTFAVEGSVANYSPHHAVGRCDLQRAPPNSETPGSARRLPPTGRTAD